MKTDNKQVAFTLAELVIAVAVLGIITAFSIPKIVTAYQASEYNSLTKKSLSIIVEAIEQYKAANGTVNGLTTAKLLPYIHYTKLFPNGYQYDYIFGSPVTCASNGCVELHNGALIDIQAAGYCTNEQLPANQDAFNVTVDPDGKVTDPAINPNYDQSIQFWVYRNGRIATRKTTNNPTYTWCNTSYNFTPTGFDPPWFKWN